MLQWPECTCSQKPWHRMPHSKTRQEMRKVKPRADHW